MGPVCSDERAEACAPALTSALFYAECNTVTRAAALLAQVAWESGQLRFLVEPEDNGRNYEGRADLGNVQPGDGMRFRGRGFLQITGRRNYQAAGAALGLTLESEPDLAAELHIAASITAWFWVTNGLNALADARDFRGITERTNGKATEGPPSYHERRERHYRAALEVLGLAALIA
jgi:putative chitinase